MANFLYNRSLGRWVEFCERVNGNDPTNAVLVLMVLRTASIETDAVLKDKDDFAAVVAGTTDEATNSGYGRKTLDQTGGIVITYDDTNDRVDVDYPDPVWTAVTAGDNWSDVVSGYDSDSTAGTDAGILPMMQHDFPINPDGSDIVGVVAAAGFGRAQ